MRRKKKFPSRMHFLHYFSLFLLFLFSLLFFFLPYLISLLMPLMKHAKEEEVSKPNAFPSLFLSFLVISLFSSFLLLTLSNIAPNAVNETCEGRRSFQAECISFIISLFSCYFSFLFFSSSYLI